MSALNREPAVAGMFYPADPAVLGGMVDEYLNEAKTTGPAPKAMIVPHAGYIYSGPVAATAYARLQTARDTIKRVVLMGPTHRVAVQGLATVSVNTFTTPLGVIPIDQEALGLVKDLPQVVVSDLAHQQEHSLEVHLPFLQACLDDFSLVPFAVGEASPKQVAEVLEKLWGGDETLIVISSDLSHFLDYQTAQKKDRITSEHIVSLEFEQIGYGDACGRNPVNGLLYVARQHGYDVELLDLRNSGDTAGDKSRVVGYGAYVLMNSQSKDVVTGKKTDTGLGTGRYTWDDGQQLIKLAKASIKHGLETGQPLPVNPEDYNQALGEQRACFVTLNENNQLRGCIGSLEAHRPLVKDVSDNAYAAAFRDPRFPPLSDAELEKLDIHISILTPASPMSFSSESDLISQLRPGKDGLILEDVGHRGTFLPSVWESLKTPEQFWRELKRKAGLPYDHWSDTIKVSRYETQYFP
jgi:AmmeMemoRadiSam system protein B/AmmeMemoRadiSam system protein A